MNRELIGKLSAGRFCIKLPGLLFKSVKHEFKVGKARLAMTLLDSEDSNVHGSQPPLNTGRKWRFGRAIEFTHHG